MNRHHRVLALLLALAICPYFLGLGASSIWDANEAFYVETPREMMERGDYISPTFNYEPRLNKPILSYWIVAGFYHVFGVSVAVQRVPIALAAVVMIGTAFFLAWAGTLGNGWPRSRPGVLDANGAGTAAPPARGGDRLEAALWAALGLAVTPRLLMFARRIFIDIYTSMFLGLTLLFFCLSERYPARRRMYLVLMYMAVGLGVMTKGPVAVVLPAAVFGVYLLAVREVRRVRTMMLPAGALIVAAIVVPYCAALYARHGWAPITGFIVGENVARYTQGVGVDAPRPPWFYLPVVLSDSFPWSLFLFVAAAGWWSSRRQGATLGDPAVRVQLLLWLWIGVIVAFFTASRAKQDLYIFPIVPAVAALGGIALARGFTGGVRWTAGAIGLLVAAAGAGLLYFVTGPGAMYSVSGAVMMSAAAILGGVLVGGAAAANRPRAAAVGVPVIFIALHWIFVLRVLPAFERYKPAPAIARTLEPRVRADDVVATYDIALPSLVYYLRRHVDPLFAPEELIERFRSGRTVYAVLSPQNYRALADALGPRTCIIGRAPTFDLKLKNMLVRETAPELLIVTNRCAAN